MNILVLGGGGFIGSHLTKRLLIEKHLPTVLDRWDDDFDCFQGKERPSLTRYDIRDQGWDLAQAVAKCDLAIDLVAYGNPGISCGTPLELFNLNFSESLRIAKACAEQKKRLIHFSACETYGRTLAHIPGGNLAVPEDPRHATFNEDASEFILGPVDKHRWIYSCARQLLERMLHAFGLESGFKFTIIRPCNFIGPKVDFLKHDREGTARIFSFFMDALIHGTPMKLVNDGANRRCYSHIDDAIDCVYRIVENIGGVCDQQIFNIGSPDNQLTILQLAEMMRETYRKKYLKPRGRLSKILFVSDQEFYGPDYDDSDRRIPDITKARTLLGWEPRWKLNDLVEAFVDYRMSTLSNPGPDEHSRSFVASSAVP